MTARWFGLAFVCILAPHAGIWFLVESGADDQWQQAVFIPISSWIRTQDWDSLVSFLDFPLWQMPLLVFTFAFGLIIGCIDQRHVWILGVIYATSRVSPFIFDYFAGHFPRMETLWFFASLLQQFLPFPFFVLGASTPLLIRGHGIGWRQFTISDLLLCALPFAFAFMTISGFLQDLNDNRVSSYTAIGPPMTILFALTCLAMALRWRAECSNEQPKGSR